MEKERRFEKNVYSTYIREQRFWLLFDKKETPRPEIDVKWNMFLVFWAVSSDFGLKVIQKNAIISNKFFYNFIWVL
jgi:hypothetical protein